MYFPILYILLFIVALNARLSNGPNRMTGRLELLRNNKWGTVCDVNFSDIHATAICRMIAGSNQAR